jgi:hypothetical protein
VILFDEADVQLAAQREVASRPRAIDPPAQDQDVERLRPQALNRSLSRARVNSGSHLYILECPDA